MERHLWPGYAPTNHAVRGDGELFSRCRWACMTQVPLPKSVITRLPRRPPHAQQKESEPPAIFIPAIPDLHVQDGCLVFRQDGQPDMVVDHINFDVTNEGDDLVLAGTIAGQPWGIWRVNGRMDHDSQAGTASLATIRPIHLTQRLVDKIRFVSPDVWKQVQVEGDLPARLAFQFDLTPGHSITMPCCGLATFECVCPSFTWM